MRNELEKRPLLVAAISLAVGISSGAIWWHSLALLPLLFLMRTNVNRGVIVAGLLAGYSLAPTPATDLVLAKSDFSGVVRIDSVPRITQNASIAQVTHGGKKLQLILPRDSFVSLGDEVKVGGQIKPLSQFSGQWVSLQGIVGSIQAKDFKTVKEGHTVFRWGMQWRKSFMTFTERSMDPEVARMIDALCFNVDAALDKDSYRNLQRTGTVHIVSASGLHVFIFGAALAFLFSKLPLPRWFQILLLVFVLLVYAGAAGFRPPIVRSVVMGAFYISAYMMKREPDLLSALAAAAATYLILDPVSLYDVGFQLSFVTVGGLALYLTIKDTFKEGEYLKDKMWEGVKASLVASLAAAPLVAFYFGNFSLLALPANLLIAAVLPLILVGALGAWAISPLAPAVSQMTMDVVVKPFVGWVSWVTGEMGELPFAAVQVPAFNAYWMLAYYAVFLLTWRKVARQP